MVIKIKNKEMRACKIVAEKFIPNPFNKDCVIRKLSKTDTHPRNLEWATHEEIGRTMKNSRTRGIYRVIDYKYYKNSREAAKDNYCCYQTILDSCNKKRKRSCVGKFVWADKLIEK
jgi:hypothetical protein